MTVQSRPLSAVRAQGVESQLRARVERLKVRPSPVGVCRSCNEIVHTGDSLAMSGGFLFHGDCAIGPQEAQTA
jgi:hypothetical protein